MSVSYDDIFMRPFEPWDTSAANGSILSEPNYILGEAVDFENNPDGGGAGASIEIEKSASAGGSWVVLPEVAVEKSEECSLDMGTPGG